MSEEEEVDRVTEYKFLKEKSHHLFDGLRDLPEYGQTLWYPYFQKTFEVYTKLWKFQQDHRSVLESDGLKRWEIGEIASKIGQLYYHYYLRTSETNFLYESFVFYNAIHDRGYFNNLTSSGKEQEKAMGPVVKQLRFYARFAVVCLLLNKRTMAENLLDMLRELVEDYTSTFNPQDSADWEFVLTEIHVFLKADSPVHLTTSAEGVLNLNFRAEGVEHDTGEQGIIVKQALLMTNRKNQTKFSQLTIDLFRILQTLELSPGSPSSSSSSSSEQLIASQRNAPLKHLLFMPTAESVLFQMASATQELEENEALLMYISANQKDESTMTSKAFDFGLSNDQAMDQVEQDVLLSSDLLPFARRHSMFLIVDSNNSSEMKENLASWAMGTMVALFSPERYAVGSILDDGSIFTLFLQSPVLGLCSLCQLTETSERVLTSALEMTESGLKEIEKDLQDRKGKLFAMLPQEFQAYIMDGYIRTIIVRYLFCLKVMTMHKEADVCSSVPEIDNKVLEWPALVDLVADLTKQLGLTKEFEF